MNDISCSSILENRNVANASHILTVLPPPPTKSHRGSLSTGTKQSSLVLENEVSPSHQPPSQPTSLVHVPPAKTSDSPCSSPTDTAASPRSSVSADRSWSFFQKDGSSNWTNFEEHHQLLGNDEENSERHSSATAKEFFEKSKLPLIELSKIWQLSDVDKDGALTIDEFCTAMHLVVLRRNNIELPDALPPSLIPKIFHKNSEADVNIPNQAQIIPSQSHVSSPKQTSPSELVSPQSKEWTKFNDSPTSSLSSPGMKPVNFDFSAASVEQDPKILHPVALRLSPERQAYPVSSEKEQPVGSTLTNQPGDMGSDAISARVYSSSFSGTSDASKGSNLVTSSQTVNLPQGPKKEPPPPPPPRPKHNHIRSSSLDLNKLGKTVPHFLGAPPAVPPRVSPSSATPLKSGTHSDEHNLSESIDFADFTNFEDAETANLHLKSGAFEVYKKPLTAQDRLIANSSAGSETFLLEQANLSAAIDDSTALLVDISHQDEESISDRKRHPSEPPLAITAASITSAPRDKRELQAAIKAHRERNMMLTLLNNELNQELSEIMEERIALEIQLEHLKQFS
ncbi:ralBP1-associated Eps domain-containing protein 1 [Trichonephila clavata]|uniref:RalBP1-associated Eps domain-containing protein 1 n=1 Tax=Trichonephila clavata TaxID=2740835 RepID=A0A8X6HAC1_TRICU|nr:ralBP1-associated Eps domain-containing protein 1 [Trichonephila clavata]